MFFRYLFLLFVLLTPIGLVHGMKAKDRPIKKQKFNETEVSSISFDVWADGIFCFISAKDAIKKDMLVCKDFFNAGKRSFTIRPFPINLNYKKIDKFFENYVGTDKKKYENNYKFKITFYIKTLNSQAHLERLSGIADRIIILGIKFSDDLEDDLWEHASDNSGILELPSLTLLQNCCNLKKFKIKGFNWDEGFIFKIGNDFLKTVFPSKIENLTFSNVLCDNSEDLAEKLQNCKELKSLKLGHYGSIWDDDLCIVYLPDNFFEKLAKSNVKSISLNYQLFDDTIDTENGFDALGSLPNLEKLTFNTCRLSAQLCKRLPSTLKELAIIGGSRDIEDEITETWVSHEILDCIPEKLEKLDVDFLLDAFIDGQKLGKMINKYKIFIHLLNNLSDPHFLFSTNSHREIL
jgi:hypothetical protein